MRHNKTHDQFIKQVADLEPCNYEVLGIYEKSSVKILFKHNECGNSFYMKPNKFLQGQRCPICRYKKIAKSNTKTHDYFLKKVFELTDEYEVMDEYVGNEVKIRFKHLSDKCDNNIFVKTPHSFLKNARCPKCSSIEKNIKNSKTNYEFINEVYGLVKDEYEVLDKYECFSKKVKFLHKKCNKVSEITPVSFTSQGVRCLHCNSSKGEVSIEDWLTLNNIDFKKQYRFEDCKNKRTLPFDFAIFNNNELTHLIEFQGRQHYEVFHSREHGVYSNIEYIQNNDNIKRKYCIDKKIRLLEISYLQLKNISDILEDEFNR